MLVKATALLVALFALATCGAASAQVDPANMVSGRDSLIGGPPPAYTTVLYTVPAGQRFVLTDVSLPDVPSGFAFPLVADDGAPRWSLAPAAMPGSTSRFWFRNDWRTGLAFDEGHQVGLVTSTTQVGGVVSWSGYLVPVATAAAPPSAPEMLGLHLSPNPSRQSVTLRFELAKPADVALSIYDVAGRRVRTIRRGHASAGAHEARWDGRTDAGPLAEAGVYFARLESDRAGSVQRLVRVR